MGNINSILNSGNQIMVSQVQGIEAKTFRECMNNCNLTELSIVGDNLLGPMDMCIAR